MTAVSHALSYPHFYIPSTLLRQQGAHRETAIPPLGRLKTQMQMTDRLLFRIYGEMYLVDLATVLYFKADDHYTHVYSSTGVHMVMPFSLGKVEAAILQHAGSESALQRMGRTFIVNLDRIHHVNVLKQSVLLADDHGNVHSLHFSRQVLQALMERLGRTFLPDPSASAQPVE